MTGWICAGLAVALSAAVVLLWLLSRGGFYKRVFADEHFLEVARALPRVKAAAVGGVYETDEPMESPENNPRVLVTSAGLVLAYTVRCDGDRYVHHYSVSAAGGVTAHSLGEPYVLFVAKLLGVPYDALNLGVGRSTVHHAEFYTDEAGLAEFAARPVAEMSATDVTSFRREWIAVREKLQWVHEP